MENNFCHIDKITLDKHLLFNWKKICLSVFFCDTNKLPELFGLEVFENGSPLPKALGCKEYDTAVNIFFVQKMFEGHNGIDTQQAEQELNYSDNSK